MSFSCRNRIVRVPLFAAIACTGSAAWGAQVTVQPLMEVGVSADSNRDLSVNGDDSSISYNAEVGALWRIATPQSVTTVRPILGYVDYPDADENSLQGVVDVISQYTGQRSKASVFGRFDRRDTYSAELASPEFNPVNPDVPTTPETGRIRVGETRTLAMVVPTYQYALTQRMNFNLSGIAQLVDYSGDTVNTGYVPYTYYNVSTGLSWALSPKSDLGFGVFGTRSDNKDDDGEADGHGVSATYDHRWNDTFSSVLALSVERDDVTTVLPTASRTRSTNWGASYTTRWKGEISRVDLSLGRTFTPSGNGGTSQADQLQLEYHRSLSERTEFSTAARYIRYESLANLASADYDYLNAVANLRWNVTHTWYVAGGVEYWREKFEVVPGTADNVRALISFGYEGLKR